MQINNILQDGIGYVELQDVMGDDLSIVNAARVSYLGESKGKNKDKGLLEYLWNHQHMSPFEMASLKLKIHCPIFTSKQWMRHRSFSYNEVSRRYTDENLEFYYPNKWRKQDTKNKQASSGSVQNNKLYDTWIKNLVLISMNTYNDMLSNDISRELARMCLPQNLYTTFIVTGNLRNWMHFIKLRSDTHAQWEIQQYSNAILDKIIKDKFPWVYDIAVHGNMTLL